MTWIKLDDGFADHPKVVAAGTDASWLYIAALCYSSRHLTDGEIPTAVVPRLADLDDPQIIAGRLVEVGLWIDCGDHYRIHDYEHHQRTRSQVIATREAAKERGSRARTSREPRAPESESESEKQSSSSSTRSTGVIHSADEDERISQAIDLVAKQRLAEANGVQNRTAWLRKVSRNLADELIPQAHDLLAKYELSVTQLADALNGKTNVLRTAPRRVS